MARKTKKRRLNLQHHKHTGKLLHHRHTSYHGLVMILLCTGLVLGMFGLLSSKVAADEQFQVTAKVFAPAPTQPAHINSPAGGSELTANPVNVSGSCQSADPQHIVKIFSNDQFVGSTLCTNGGTFSVEVDLFSGQNTLIARTFTFQDVEGPPSAPVTITFKPSEVTPPVAERPSGTDSRPGRGSGAGNEQKPFRIVSKSQNASFVRGKPFKLTFVIEGGRQPYAVSIAWGNGKRELASIGQGQEVTFDHSYKNSGTYSLRVEAVDQDGRRATLKLGITDGVSLTNVATTVGQTRPLHIDMPLLVTYSAACGAVASFWIGERWQLHKLAKKVAKR